MRGQLFTSDFLNEGIKETRFWQDLEEGVFQRSRERVQRIFSAFPASATPNEAVTEDEIIVPVLETLGWTDHLSQQSTKARRQVPDLLLFADEARKETAMSLSADVDRFRHGIALVESKRWQRSLDREDRSDPFGKGAPSTQILNYLSRAEVLSDDHIRWGMLTNGRHWRLYWQGARSRSEDFLELDVAALAQMADLQFDLDSVEAKPDQCEHYLKVFFLLFGKAAFLADPQDPTARTFHQLALEESRLWEEKVSEDLGQRVFDEVFPDLIAALAKHDAQAPDPLTKEYLDQAREAGLLLLYRLLFLLYAEDRNLLPANDDRYDDYSLRKIRLGIAKRIDEGDVFSSSATRYHTHAADLFRSINAGDRSIGLPPYNGGLFDPSASPLLERTRIPDDGFAPILDRISRHQLQDHHAWINYRDLSVQHLGSVYERLLEFDAVVSDRGEIELQPHPFARKGSGSYYTHDDLVQLLLRETVGPLRREIVTAFEQAIAKFAGAQRAKPENFAELGKADPASRLLSLKICDPAMGSGHFLVSLVDYLTDQVLEQIAAASEAAPPTNEEAYESPVVERIRTIRKQIEKAAKEGGWRLEEDRLDDRHLVRRMVLKRVVYGVDKNPMAVELAKVALWLHTFTVGAPLSFLDHHLRCGDSLYGEWVDRVTDGVSELGALHLEGTRAQLNAASHTFREVATLTDADIGEVHRSKKLYEAGETTLRPLNNLLDFWHALAWLPGKKKRSLPEHPGLRVLTQEIFGNLLEVIEAGQVQAPNEKQDAEAQAVNDILTATGEVARRERFLHWELAFPTVWQALDRRGEIGGFDAVIGNPPWDRIKLQEVEWFAERRRKIATAPRAADRKKKIRALEKKGDPLWALFQAAKARAETAASVARSGGQYPLLSKGDINLYSLFVERATRLIRPGGVVGLLTPSGIASDKTAAAFFREIATTGRLGALFDFENKKIFFPDIHASFKFSALVFGGRERTFPEASCAFFLHSVDELENPERSFPLGPQDFSAVNPNTGTAPIFRTRRDAEITTAIYERLPVLVDRRTAPPTKAWPVRYVRMFDMTNDSHLFKRRDELEAKGYYPVAGNRWKKGEEEYVPLYEGKMVQMYDHRAASIKVNPANVQRPASPLEPSMNQKMLPTWLPDPQYWVPLASVTLRPLWAVAFKDVTAPTNRRTMISAIVAACGMGNTLPALVPSTDDTRSYRGSAPLLVANLNAFVFDYLARQKVQGQHLNLYIAEQIPVYTVEQLGSRKLNSSLLEHIRDQVLHLSYTAIDLEPFARDMGYEGDPFPWDEEDRRHRMARLDALFFHLYGVDRNDADYILNTFPIVRAEDEKEFGRFLTRDLILAYMNAVAAGDFETRVSA